MKYIIKDGCAIVFSEALSHREVAGDTFRLESAGFVSISASDNELHVSCWGESLTLNIKSRGEVDAKIILQQIGD